MTFQSPGREKLGVAGGEDHLVDLFEVLIRLVVEFGGFRPTVRFVSLASC
jgi:hypothetical protein